MMTLNRMMLTATLGMSVLTTSAHAADICNECEVVLGDVNEDGVADLTDAGLLMAIDFQEEDPPYCMERGDVNDNGYVDFTDGNYLFAYLVLGWFEEPRNVERGDANGDDLVDQTDYIVLATYLFDSTAEVCHVGADLNSDGAVDMTDLILMTELLYEFTYG